MRFLKINPNSTSLEDSKINQKKIVAGVGKNIEFDFSLLNYGVENMEEPLVSGFKFHSSEIFPQIFE